MAKNKYGGICNVTNPDKRVYCEYMGVVKCLISSCYRRGRKCKGYRIAKMDGERREG